MLTHIPTKPNLSGFGSISLYRRNPNEHIEHLPGSEIQF